MIGPSKEGEAILAKMGMAPRQMAEDLRKPDGLLKAPQDLKSHLSTLAPTERENVVVKLFGRRESGRMLTLIEQMDRLRLKYELVGKGAKDFNQDWKATTHTLGFLLGQLKTLGEVALIKVGGALSKAIGWVKGLGEAFEHGKIWAQVVVAQAAGVGALALSIKAVSVAFTTPRVALHENRPVTLKFPATGTLAVGPWEGMVEGTDRLTLGESVETVIADGAGGPVYTGTLDCNAPSPTELGAVEIILP